jgi:enamine deaminase RidA (YjgF/YER057c/UK114 family)
MRQFLLTAAALACAGGAHAADVKHVGAPSAPIASAVVVPPGATTVYVSGITPKAITPAANGAPADFGDIKAQTTSSLGQISDILKGEGMTMGDVVMMRVYMAADSTGKIDTAAMNEVFRTFFGTADQPNKPARVTFQVARLVNPALLIEIEAQAAKAPSKSGKKHAKA